MSAKRISIIDHVRRLKVYFQNKLKDSGVECAGDRAESRIAEVAVWVSERGRIRHVEGFGAELRTKALRYRKDLAHHYVECFVTRTDDRVSRTIADSKLRSLAKCGGVEPTARASLIRRQYRVYESVRTLNSKTGERVQIGCLRNSDRTPGLNAGNACKLPSSDDRISPAAQRVMSASAER
jgi:hypothetical protein